MINHQTSISGVLRILGKTIVVLVVVQGDIVEP